MVLISISLKDSKVEIFSCNLHLYILFAKYCFISLYGF